SATQTNTETGSVSRVGLMVSVRIGAHRLSTAHIARTTYGMNLPAWRVASSIKQASTTSSRAKTVSVKANRPISNRTGPMMTASKNTEWKSGLCHSAIRDVSTGEELTL